MPETNTPQLQATQGTGSSIILAGLTLALFAAHHGSGQAQVVKLPRGYRILHSSGTSHSVTTGVSPTEFFGCVSRIVNDLLENEATLDEESARLLRDNLFDLYA